MMVIFVDIRVCNWLWYGEQGGCKRCSKNSVKQAMELSENVCESCFSISQMETSPQYVESVQNIANRVGIENCLEDGSKLSSQA